MTRVIWFNNSHEDRNDLLRFGLMRMHGSGKLDYEERPLRQCVDFGFSPTVAEHVHRHTSVVLVKGNSAVVRCLVDSEDSFFWMSSLIREVDVYFCAGYNTDFFENHVFVPPYAWQKPHDTAFYQKRAVSLIQNFADYFGRVRPFVPIGPSMSQRLPIGWVRQKYRNADHKVRLSLGAASSWRFKYQDFELRYQNLLAHREAPLCYDVVLWDTLWGWPRHRYALHRRLRSLAGRYNIHARLDWSEPSIHDGSVGESLDRSQFPLTSGAIDDYEYMLASSRLAILATGFHWGWRSILTLALLWGLPIWTDRLLLEPWFDMSPFEIYWNDTEDWRGLQEHLDVIDEDDWKRIKVRNQRAYDEVMAPDKVAQYFVAAALHGERRDSKRERLTSALGPRYHSGSHVG